MEETAGTIDSAWLWKDPKPFKQGAEAYLYRCIYFGRKAVIKERFVKTYRYERGGRHLNFYGNFDRFNLLLEGFLILGVLLKELN